MAEVLKSKLATLGLGLVLIFVSFLTIKIIVQKNRIDSEISSLQKQADKVKNDNAQLSFLLKYFTTKDYQEKEAREKLNLVKDGEQVVILPVTSGDSTEVASTDQKPANYKLWFNYFFNHEN